MKLYWPLVFSLIATLAIVTTVSALAMENDRHLLVGDLLVQDPVTIHTTLQADQICELGSSCNVGEIIIAGLTADPAANKAGLLVTWSLEEHGWLPRWTLQLRSEAGWNPVLVTMGSTLDTGGASVTSASTTFSSADASAAANTPTTAIELTSVWPEGGHKYDVYLSYRRTTGEGRLSVIDSSGEKLIYASDFRTTKIDKPLYPLVGSIGETNTELRGLSQTIADIYNAYIPVSTDWQLCSTADSQPVGKLRFEPDEQLYLDLTVPAGLTDGSYRLWNVTSSARTLLTTVAGTIDFYDYGKPVQMPDVSGVKK
jgi:hypothetical protein